MNLSGAGGADATDTITTATRARSRRARVNGCLADRAGRTKLACIARDNETHPACPVIRLAPILSAFALGALVSWWMLSPDQIVRETTVVKYDTTESVRTAVVDDPRIGIPPDSVTPSRPAPNAGQRRALARALDGLERNPPEVPAMPVDPDTTAAFGDALRAALIEETSR